MPIRGCLRLELRLMRTTRSAPEMLAWRICGLMTAAILVWGPRRSSGSTNSCTIQTKVPAVLLLRSRAAHSGSLRAHRKATTRSRRHPAPSAYAVEVKGAAVGRHLHPRLHPCHRSGARAFGELAHLRRGGSSAAFN